MRGSYGSRKGRRENPSVLTPAGVIELERGLDLFECLFLGVAPHMNAGEFFCFGHPCPVIVLIYIKFPHF